MKTQQMEDSNLSPKLILLIVLVVAFAFLEISLSHHLIKKTALPGHLELSQKYHLDFDNKLTSMKPGKLPDLQQIESITKDINHQALKCLAHQSMILDLFFSFSSKTIIFELCKENTLAAIHVLESIDNYEQSLMDNAQLAQILESFNAELSLNHEPFNTFIMDFRHDFFITLAIFIALNSWAIIACIHCFSGPSSDSYRNLLITNEQLRKAEKRLSLYYRASNVGIWEIADIRAEEIYWSSQVKTLLGYDFDDDIQPTSSTLIHLIHPDHRERVRKSCMSAALNSLRVDEDFLVHTKYKGYRWFRGRAIGSIDKESGARRLTGSVHDIHAEKIAEQKLSESVAFMKLVLDNNPDMVFVKNRKHQVVDGNKAYFSEYPNEIMEKHRELYPEKFKALDADDDRAFDKGFAESVHNLTLPSGRTRNYHSRKIRFKNFDNEEFLLVLAHDLTDTDQLIAQISRSNQDLEQFAFIASHDLQEPLRMIGSFSELLKDRIASDLDSESSEYLRVIQLSVKRMQGLIHDLLVYAKVDERDNEAYEEIDLNRITQEVIENYQQRIKETDAIVTFDYLPTLIVRKSLLRILLSNLFSNAMKYQKPGNSPRIHISVIENMGGWTFCVEDNGIGFEEKFKSHIFLPFKRLHRKEEYLGTGIGLAICKKAAEQLGGSIWVESSVGAGSKFFFNLPKKPNA